MAKTKSNRTRRFSKNKKGGVKTRSAALNAPRSRSRSRVPVRSRSAARDRSRSRDRDRSRSRSRSHLSTPPAAAPAPPPMPFPAPPVIAPPVIAPLPAAEEPDSCPICLEQEPLCDIMPCGHKLCQTCYDRIVPKNCPFCREPMIRLKCHNLYNKILQILQGGDPLYKGHDMNGLLKYCYVNHIFTNGLKRRRPNPAYPDWYEHSGIELSEWNKETGKNWVVTIPPSEPNNYAADLLELNSLLEFSIVRIEQRNTNRGVISYVKFLHNPATWEPPF